MNQTAEIYNTHMISTSQVTQKSKEQTKKIVGLFNKRLKRNLQAIILTGSLQTKGFNEKWSDIDIIIILDEINLRDEATTAKTSKELEKKLGRHIGINILTKRQAERPIKPSVFIPGKSLQMFNEFTSDQVIYQRDPSLKLFRPNKKEVREYSLINIGFLQTFSRRTLSTNTLRTKSDYKKTLEKEIRIAFIITKLAVQYFTGKTCDTKPIIIETASITLKRFDFSPLIKMQRLIDHWGTPMTKKNYINRLKIANNYIENFCEYVQRRIAK